MTDDNDFENMGNLEEPLAAESRAEREDQEDMSVESMSLGFTPKAVVVLQKIQDIAGSRDEISLEKGKLERRADGISWAYNGELIEQLDMETREELVKSLRAKGIAL